MDKIGLSGVRAELAENQIPEPVIEKLLALLQIEGDAETVLNALSEQLGDSEVANEGVADLEELNGYLATLGVPEEFYKINVSMVRGLEYYTGPIYETVVEEPKIGSTQGGGRYDELIGSSVGKVTPQRGTSFGIERIIDVMEEFDMFPSAVGKTVTQVLVLFLMPNSPKSL